MTIRVLVVDDEPPARQRMRKLIQAEPDLELVAECEDAPDALAKITELRPQLAFMDIRLPGMSGLELSRMLHGKGSPYVVFTTASGEYALEAFKVDAVDYLMKPFDQQRFRQALDKVRAHLRLPTAIRADVDVDQLVARLTALAGAASDPAARRLGVKDGTKLKLLDLDEIAYMKADGDYLQIAKINGEKTLVRGKITGMEQRVAGSHFMRISRSVLLNLDQLAELKPHQRGDYEFVTKSGDRFTSGPTYRDAVHELLQKMK